MWPPIRITQAGEAGVLPWPHLCPQEIHLSFKGTGAQWLLPVPFAPEATRAAVFHRVVCVIAGQLGRDRKQRTLNRGATDLKKILPPRKQVYSKCLPVTCPSGPLSTSSGPCGRSCDLGPWRDCRGRNVYATGKGNNILPSRNTGICIFPHLPPTTQVCTGKCCTLSSHLQQSQDKGQHAPVEGSCIRKIEQKHGNFSKCFF